MSWLSEVLADGPWAAYMADGSSTVTTLADTGSNDTDWSLTRSVTLERPPLPSGSAGTAVAGTGTAPIASLDTCPASLAGDEMAVSLWFYKPAANMNGALVHLGDAANGWAFGIGGTTIDNSGSNLVLITEGVAHHGTGYAFTTGIHHIVVVRGVGNAVTVYDNDTVAWSGSLSSPVTPTGLHLGAWATSTRVLPSTVDMDKVAFFDTPLSAARVTAHYNGGAGDDAAVAADSPVILLECDETGVAGNLADFSDNDRTLFVTGSPVLGVDGPASLLASEFPAGTYARTMDAEHTTSPATIECFLYLDSLPTGRMPLVGSATEYLASSYDKALVVETDGRVRWYVNNGAENYVFSDALAIGTWYHVVASVGAAGQKIRVDKVTEATDAAVTSSYTGGSQELLIHGGGATAHAGSTSNGAVKVAAVAFFTSQLTDERTDAHYDAVFSPDAGNVLVVTFPAFGGAALTVDNAHHIDVSNAGTLRQRTMRCNVEITYPVAPVPAGVSEAERHDAIIAYPLPDMDNGRPT